MNEDSTSTSQNGRGINDDAETSRRLTHTPSNEPYQDLDRFREPPAGLTAAVLGKSNYGRRRSESAPDALLDCLHCGKDLLDLRDRSSYKPKRRHSRRYTVASERVRSPQKFTCSLRTSCAQTHREEERCNCEVCESSYLSGQRRDRRCARGDTRRDNCCGDHTTCCDFIAGQEGEQASRKHSHNKKSTSRRDEKTWTQSTDTDIYPQAFTFDHSLTDDIAGYDGAYHPDRCPPVTSGRKSHKYKADRDGDITFDDDSEAELTNVNENRRRNSLTNFIGHGHREGLKVEERSKRKRRSYPGNTSKTPVRAHHLAEPSGDRTTSSHNHMCNVRHLASRCVEKNDPQSPTSEDDENEEEVEASEVKHHSCQRDSLLITNLSDMLRRHRLCDVTLRSHGQEVSAHKLALAAFSDTFARTYCEGESGEVVIDIPDTSVGGIQEVLRFVYTGELRLTPDNVGHVLATAAFLHIHHVVNTCRQMLLKPDIETVISFSFLAEKYHLSEDLTYFYDYMCKHFLFVSRTRGWKTLAFAQVFDLLSEDNLNVERELDVFRAAVAWIDSDRTNRLTLAADLIGCVRFAYITPDEIAKHVETKHFLFQGDEGKELLLCIYRFIRPCPCCVDITRL